MKRRTFRNSRWMGAAWGALTLALAMVPAMGGAVVFEDNFESYADTADLRTVWNKGGFGDAHLALATTDPYAGSQHAWLTNGGDHGVMSTIARILTVEADTVYEVTMQVAHPDTGRTTLVKVSLHYQPPGGVPLTIISALIPNTEDGPHGYRELALTFDTSLPENHGYVGVSVWMQIAASHGSKNFGNAYIDDVLVTSTPALHPPTGVTVEAVSASALEVTWTDHANATSCAIERSADGVNGWSSVATVPAGTGAWQDGGLPPGSTWYYQLYSVGSEGVSGPCPAESGTTLSLFEDWKVLHGIALGAPDDDDSDRDGVPLLVEYGVGLDPQVNSSASAPRSVVDGGLLVLTYARLRAELAYAVEASETLDGWSTTGVTQEWQVAGDDVTASVTRSGFPVRFLHLRVTRAP